MNSLKEKKCCHVNNEFQVNKETYKIAMEMALSGYSSTSDSGFDIVILDFFFQVSTKDIFA